MFQKAVNSKNYWKSVEEGGKREIGKLAYSKSLRVLQSISGKDLGVRKKILIFLHIHTWIP